MPHVAGATAYWIVPHLEMLLVVDGSDDLNGVVVLICSCFIPTQSLLGTEEVVIWWMIGASVNRHCNVLHAMDSLTRSIWLCPLFMF